MHLAIDDAVEQELARRLAAGCIAAAVPPTIPPRDDGVRPPMSDEQRHVWLHSQTDPDAPFYNEPITIRYRGRFDYHAFLSAFDDLLDRHEAWRTSFDALDSDPVQVIHDDLHADFPLVDLSELPPEQRESEARAMAEADARKPFRLDAAPLFRGRVIRIADDDHRLYITLHHIIFDGASIYQVMMPELAELYAAHLEGRPPALPDRPIGYGDYAAWQRRRQTELDALYRSQTAYWQATLDGALPMLELPTDRPPPAIRTARGALETFRVDEPLVTRLKTLGRAHGATLYMTLLAGFNVLLHRYSGQEDIIIGGVTDTRRRRELMRMMGYCLNCVPLRTRPRPDMPFAAFLADLRDVVLGAIENSDVPFEGVVRALKLNAAAGQHPIFQTLFSIEPPKPPLPPGWQLSQMEVSHDSAKLDLYLEIDEHHDGSMTGRLMYSTDLFDRETIQAMIGHWTTLLDSIAAAPETPLRMLGLRASGEETSQNDLTRGPERAIPPTTIHGLVRGMAARKPDAPAVRFGRETLSYAALIDRVDVLAAELRLAGVEPGALVGLCVTRSLEMVIAALAILQRGAAYLPLDPSFPPARLDAIVEDADPAAIVTQAALAAQLPGWGRPVVLCDRVVERHHLKLLPLATDPEALAYVMYTSGSTGVPKGVEIRHRSAVNLLLSMQREPGFGEHDTLLAVTTPTFDISVLEMFLPLASGGTVVIASSAETVDPEKLRVAIERSRCTVMQATPATWQNLFATGWPGVPGLRILCGGEALPGDLARRMLDAGMELWNVYGPTETTIWSSLQKVESPDDITIGRPIENTTLLVLDADGRLQPFNVAGELHIGGAGLARGYRDPELTAQAFVDTPDHGRLYRTGDIARQRRDGRFEWLGRRDGQVKVRGLRIDLGDAEAALAAHPDVAMAAVRTFDDESGQKSLAAYTVTRGAGTPPSATELRDFLRRTLPPYMVPARYIALEAMPLSSNGKIDRKALPEPQSSGNAAPPSEPPCGECETRLAALWMDVLGIDTINAHDDFQELGGHSLLAARLMAQIERTFGRKLPLSTLLHAPTLRGMAAHLEGATPAPERVEIVTLREGERAPLFWIDAVPNFRPIRYRALAAAFGAGRPLLGLPVDVERHDGLRETASLAALAADLVDTIRANAAEPYLIGGWCNGAILAHEVAAQLIAGGGEVGLLVVLDAPNPVSFRKRGTRMAAQIQQLWTLPRGQRGQFAAETIEGYLARLHRRFQRTSDDDTELFDLNDRFMRLVNRYEPAPLGVPTLLLQPRDGKIDYGPGWRPVTGAALETVDVDGGHASVLDPPHAAGLAAEIERRLDEIGAEAVTLAAE